MPVDAPPALPRYRQISDLLEREIDAGRLMDGDRLDPERQLAVRLGTSVGTLRKALAHLEHSGLLERRHGSGNYIRRPSERETTYAFFRIERLTGGGHPSADLLSVDRLPKPDAAPPFGRSHEGHRIRRLRRLDGHPAVLEEIWLDGDVAGRLDPSALQQSLYKSYRDDLGLWIARAEDTVSFGPCPGWAPAAFGPAPGAMTTVVERISWSQAGAAVEWSVSHVDAAVATYVNRIK
ncbi:MAG: GntR family transcriptional regulator [Pseudomonadota bacterium]